MTLGFPAAPSVDLSNQPHSGAFPKTWELGKLLPLLNTPPLLGLGHCPALLDPLSLELLYFLILCHFPGTLGGGGDENVKLAFHVHAGWTIRDSSLRLLSPYTSESTLQSPGAVQPLRIPDSVQRCLLQWLLTERQ